MPIVLPITGKKCRNKYHDQTTHSNTVKGSFEIISFAQHSVVVTKRKKKLKFGQDKIRSSCPLPRTCI